MKKTKLSFSDFLIRKHGVSVLDFYETKVPDFWRGFRNVKAMAFRWNYDLHPLVVANLRSGLFVKLNK